MTLNWLRAGCASIAESGELTAIVYHRDFQDPEQWRSAIVKPCGDVLTSTWVVSREAAEAACEQWLEDNDKPVWHDVTEWLSWAEWRGWKLLVCPGGCGRSVCRVASDENDVKCFYNPQPQHVKAAAEKYVRAQTGGAA